MHLDNLNHISATARLAENGAMLLCVWFLNKEDYYSAHTVVITHNATAILHSNTAFFFFLCYSLSYNPFLQKLISDGKMAIFLWSIYIYHLIKPESQADLENTHAQDGAIFLLFMSMQFSPFIQCNFAPLFNLDPGGYLVQKTLRGCAANMGSKISLFVYEWPLIKCKIWYTNGSIFQNLVKFEPKLAQI